MVLTKVDTIKVSKWENGGSRAVAYEKVKDRVREVLEEEGWAAGVLAENDGEEGGEGGAGGAGGVGVADIVVASAKARPPVGRDVLWRMMWKAVEETE